MLLPLDEVPVHVPLRRPRSDRNSPPRPPAATHPAPPARTPPPRPRFEQSLHPVRKKSGCSKPALGVLNCEKQGIYVFVVSYYTCTIPCRPRPLRFERLRVPVWNPYSRGRLSPAKSEDRKGGEGKTDANLTHFFKHRRSGWHPNSPPRPGEAPHPRPPPHKLCNTTYNKNYHRAPLR